ncbi:hypothetical protein BJF88_10095 [Cellulosimicrobium sp. CUA-896]|nr:hypothetical protein BJF88_10095 [Cellulosimicrobium sp. CUA-896]
MGIDPRDVVRELSRDESGGRRAVTVLTYVRHMEAMGYTGEAAVRALEGLVKDGTLKLTSKYTIVEP